MTASWKILSTPPLSGEENMDIDSRVLERVAQRRDPPTLRFFRFSEPTVSFGRLQRLEAVRPVAPSDWPAVRRPTGGGIVFHDGDLCLSLCWPLGDGPLPLQPSAQYEWIHRVILEAVSPLAKARLASCCDTPAPAEPFDVRRCFTRPVGFDLLADGRKVVGGALARRREATLYQGSIQALSPDTLEPLLAAAFQRHLSLLHA